MKKSILAVVFLVVVGGIAVVRFSKNTPAVNAPLSVETTKEESVLVSPPQSDIIVAQAFFGNRITDPNVVNCDRVYPVERVVPKTQAVARAALEEMLAGPTLLEGQAGYFTSMNDGVKIQKLNIANGTAFVDFDETLEAQVGGSCRVLAIRAQIKETLKQFPTVKNVVLTVNGRGEDIILQP